MILKRQIKHLTNVETGAFSTAISKSKKESSIVGIVNLVKNNLQGYIVWNCIPLTLLKRGGIVSFKMRLSA